MATKAPKVETLAKSMAALDPGYREQRNLINEQIAGLSGLYGAQREALDATKVQSFNQINDQATGRGAAFSGIPVHEQADYLSTHYLPGLTNLANQENAERMQYRQDMARLNTEQRNIAISRIDQQQSALNQWNLQQAQLQAQARENELNRKFQAAQNAADRAAQAAEGAANRAANAPDLYADIFNTFTKTAGGDRYVSGANYKQQKAFAARYGMSGADFDRNYAQFRNPASTAQYR